MRERCGWPEALVDGVGRARYAPANLAAIMSGLTEDNITKPTALELRLLEASATRFPAATLLAAPDAAASACPLKQQGGECRCGA